MISRDTKGVYAIAPTPFHDDGSIDFDSIDRLASFYEGAGVDGLTVLGSLGEAPKLTADEAQAVACRFLGATRLPVVVGVSAPGLAPIAQLSEEVMAAGAAGVMVSPRAGLRTDDQIVAYFGQAAEAVGSETPFVVQDFPLTFEVVMSPAVIGRIATENDNAVLLKHEDWPGLDKITAVRRMSEAGQMPRMSILTGFGGGFLDLELSRGADGAMTGYAFPEMLVSVVAHSDAGNVDAALDVFDAHLPLVRYEQQPGVGLAVRKYVLHKRGVISSQAQRRPAPAFSPETRADVDLLLARLMRTDDGGAIRFAV